MPRKSITKEFSRHSAQASLRRVLIIPFVLQIVAVIVLIGWLSLENGQQAVNNVAGQLRSSIIGRIEQRLEDYLFTPKLITQLSIQEIQQQHINIQEPEKLINSIQGQMRLFDTVNHIKFGFTDKNFISLERFDQSSFRVSISRVENDYGFSTYNLSPVNTNFLGQEQLIDTQSEFDLQKQPWYKGPIEAGKPVWSPIYTQFNTPRLAITYSVPIYDQQQNSSELPGLIYPCPRSGNF
ncbi:MAG: hypothetical protein HC916_21015 [Coleofasciculaceae cyanobacterium SM2_1_6]|nr:hypothetical protein [Coleofasciculaceae cyanobacterium SM2_1_6]